MKFAAKLTDRTFGVEFEIIHNDRNQMIRKFEEKGLMLVSESYNHSTRPYWKIVTDASVRGGYEIVSPILKGKDGLEAVNKACEAMTEAGATISRTCGTHVHFGANDLATEDIKRFLLMYSKYEEALDKLVPPSRRDNENQYCRNLKLGLDYTNFRKYLLSKNDVLLGSRYMKVNTYSLSKHGTVEVRHFGGTTNGEKIVSWILLCLAMIEKTRTMRNVPAAAKNDQLVLALVYNMGMTNKEADDEFKKAAKYLVKRGDGQVA